MCLFNRANCIEMASLSNSRWQNRKQRQTTENNYSKAELIQKRKRTYKISGNDFKDAALPKKIPVTEFTRESLKII